MTLPRIKIEQSVALERSRTLAYTPPPSDKAGK
jgi:hypothetical protein